MDLDLSAADLAALASDTFSQDILHVLNSANLSHPASSAALAKAFSLVQIRAQRSRAEVAAICALKSDAEAQQLALKQERERLELEKSQLAANQQNAQLNQEINSIYSKMTKLSRCHSECTSAEEKARILKQSSDAIDKLHSSVIEWERLKAALENTVAGLKNQNLAMAKSIDSSAREKRESDKLIQTLNDEKHNLTIVVNSLTADKIAVQESLEEVRQELRTSTGAWGEERLRLQASISTIQGENNVLSRSCLELEELRRVKSSLEIEAAAFDLQKATMDSDKATLHATIASLEQDIIKYKTSQSDLQHEKASLSTRINNLTEDNNSLSISLSKSKEENSTIEGRIATLEDGNSNLVTTNMKLATDMICMTQDCRALALLKERRPMYIKMIRKLCAQLLSLSRRFCEQEEVHSSLSTEFELGKKKVCDMEAHIANDSNEIARLCSQISDLQSAATSQASIHKEAIGDAGSEIASLTKQKDDIAASMETIIRARDALKLQLPSTPIDPRAQLPQTPGSNPINSINLASMQRESNGVHENDQPSSRKRRRVDDGVLGRNSWEELIDEQSMVMRGFSFVDGTDLFLARGAIASSFAGKKDWNTNLEKYNKSPAAKKQHWQCLRSINCTGNAARIKDDGMCSACKDKGVECPQVKDAGGRILVRVISRPKRVK